MFSDLYNVDVIILHGKAKEGGWPKSISVQSRVSDRSGFPPFE